MLPDIDELQLLIRLRANPTTSSIPVIVCSVARERDLALSLGAFRYLKKPIRPREFMQAPDQARFQAATATLKPPASTLGAY